MLRTPTLVSVATIGLVLAGFASPLAGQAGKPPTISSRMFTGGSARVTVKGSFQVDQDVAINTQASYGDGEFTWLQFGASGSAAPNALITYGDQGVGVNAAVGKRTAIAEGVNCSGKVDVTPKSVTGQYTCRGVTSFDAATGQMGKVDIEIRFTATS
jgi:hypothetical protein